MAELRPCPFCGSEVELRIVETKIGKKTKIRCLNQYCYMRYPTAFTSWHNDDTEEHAELRLTTAWNRRARDG